MKYCPKCGAALKDKAVYCTNCGAKLNPHQVLRKPPIKTPSDDYKSQSFIFDDDVSVYGPKDLKAHKKVTKTRAPKQEEQKIIANPGLEMANKDYLEEEKKENDEAKAKKKQEAKEKATQIKEEKKAAKKIEAIKKKEKKQQEKEAKIAAKEAKKAEKLAEEEKVIVITEADHKDHSSLFGFILIAVFVSIIIAGGSAFLIPYMSTSHNVAQQEEAKQEEEQAKKDYLLPDSSKTELTEDDLAGFSKKKLNLAKNEIYARNGYIFSSSELATYFKGKSWYRKRIKESDATSNQSSVYERMSKIEKKNIAFIIKYGKSKGWNV